MKGLERMKRCFAFLFALFLVAGLAACGAENEAPLEATPAPSPVVTETPEQIPALPTLTIGALFTLSGDGHIIGEAQLNAMRLWLDERDWQIGSYHVVLNYRDDGGSAETALAEAQALIETGADLLFGGHLASAGYAIGEAAVTAGIPYIIPVAAGDDMTQRRRQDLLIRTGSSSSQATHPFGYWAHHTRGLQSVGIIAVDNALGHGSVAGFRRTFEEAGGEVLGVPMWVPSGTSDFVPFLQQIPYEIDALFIQFEGEYARRILEAVHSMNRGDIILLGGTTTTDALILNQLTGDAALGIYSASAWLDDASFYAMESYAAMEFLEATILQAGGFVNNLEAFLAAIRTIEVETLKGNIYLDEWNNPVQDVHIRRVENVDGRLLNAHVYTFPMVSQFWHYDPAEFLALPMYDRDFHTAAHNYLLDALRQALRELAEAGK